MRYRLCLMHPIDPRGSKIGGIETHVRQVIDHCPADFSILLVGLDGVGDLEPGVPVKLTRNGRTFDFLPVVHYPEERIHEAAKKLYQSVTLHFSLGALRHLATIRRLMASQPGSAELQRFELALFPKLLGLPAVQLIHGEGSRTDTMDSLIKRYWPIHIANQSLAVRLARVILCVNGNIVAKLKREYPKHARKAEMMTVPVDTSVFRPSRFPSLDGKFRILFAGRLDAFKNPPLMFETLARLNAQRPGGVEFHYVGTSDPHRFDEFRLIEPITVRHGFQTPQGVASLMAQCHAGVLTSGFEGMPCYVLEMLASGRPLVSVHLPQLDEVIQPGISGALVTRGADDGETAARLCDAFLEVEAEIAAGTLMPDAIAAMAAPFSIERQLGRLYDHHRRLQSQASIISGVTLTPGSVPLTWRSGDQA